MFRITHLIRVIRSIRCHHLSDWRISMAGAISGSKNWGVLAAASRLVVLLIVFRVGAAAQTADWPTYGHDLHRTFSTQTMLTPAAVPGLAQAWFFETDDVANSVNGAVSAQP